jgi:diguanylate cyclase
MRSTESKERSAEILRAALALMAQHDATLNPLTFAVWSEHAAGVNSRLSRAIEECLRTEPRLGDGTVARLHREHVNEPDERAMRHASGELDRVMSGMVESAARTADKAGLFGETLSGPQQALHASASPELQPMVSRVLEGTAEMKDSAVAQQRQVASVARRSSARATTCVAPATKR